MIPRIIPLIAAIALVAAACSSAGSANDTVPSPTLTTTSSTVANTTTTSAPEETTTTTAPDDGFPVTIEAPNGQVTIQSKPERIVSISPTSTEVLFAIGAGPQVVAVDDQSNFPQEAPVTDISGFTPNIEAIASYNPDLVFLSFDPGDVIASLEAIGIPVILHPTALTLDDAYGQWEQTGVATGRIAESVELVETTTASIDAAVQSLPEGAGALSYYHELDPTYFSVTSATFVGNLYALTGMTNIADAADPDGYGFPQLAAEYIVDSDPSLIYLADTKCCGQNGDEVAARPGWNALSAVTNGAVVELDDDIASRWGPRITDFFDVVVASILELANA
ncbi:MAG: ABC transporter substrate-binding protein [Acidimicrobiia bacterium]|nr:MAG: ABC transporter substrate-binding protein [Acidimicrobiia bacterium]